MSAYAPPAAATICVPVYNGAAFVRETLQSACAQTWRGVKIRVSVDRSDDDSLAACREFLHDDRCTVTAQTERLGWIANVNFLLRSVDTEFFVILPHDDVLDRRYVERLLEEARRRPDAAVVYADMERFGDRRGYWHEDAVMGDRRSRIVQYLTGRSDAVPFRGLVRASLCGGLYLRDNDYDGFAVDALWLLELAGRGDLCRVPEPLYRKRVTGSSVVAGWSRWRRDRIVAAWVDHCVACAAIASAMARDDAERALFSFASFARLLSAFNDLGYSGSIRPRTLAETVALGSFYVSRLHERASIPDLDRFLAMPDIVSLPAWRLRERGGPAPRRWRPQGISVRAVKWLRSMGMKN